MPFWRGRIRGIVMTNLYEEASKMHSPHEVLLSPHMHIAHDRYFEMSALSINDPWK